MDSRADTSKCLVKKIAGEENLADSSKLLLLGAFKEEESRRIPHIVWPYVRAFQTDV